MFENNNNNNYHEANFHPVENQIEPGTVKSTGNKASRMIAGILAVVLAGGASGFGGAYLSNSVFGNNTASVSENVNLPVNQNDNNNLIESVTEVSASSENTETEKIETMLNTDSNTSKSLTTSDVIKKATPSVVLVTSEFSEGSGTGTGVIMTADGYIFTNCHVIETETYDMDTENINPFSGFFGNNFTPVVEKAAKVTVTLADETEYEAEIIGSDSATDLAILKINAKGLAPAEIGSSDNLELGQKGITLGYPLGLGLSASEGIISGLNKDMTIELSGGGSSDMTLIQTTAAINPGNSGGPLLNEFGQVIGITSSKIVSSEIEGIGFAIPITDAMPLLNELLETGTVKDTTPKIGITGSDINEAVARYYSLPVNEGVIVITVDSGSAAEKAGIKEGDVIVGADGEDIINMDELIKAKNKHELGESMTLTLARNGGNIDIEINFE